MSVGKLYLEDRVRKYLDNLTILKFDQIILCQEFILLNILSSTCIRKDNRIGIGDKDAVFIVSGKLTVSSYYRPAVF